MPKRRPPFELGDVEDIAILIRQTDDFGNPINPDIIVSNQVVSIYRCPGLTLEIDHAPAVLENMTQALKVSYTVDTGALGAGNYVAKFEYDRDGARHRVHVVDFDVLDLRC